MSDAPAGDDDLDDEGEDFNAIDDDDVDDDDLHDDDVDDDDVDDDVDDDEDDDEDDDDVGNRMPAPTAAAVLEYLVRALVDEPDGVEVDAFDRSRGVQLEVKVAPGDMGRVIGKRGRTAQAIRTVTRAAAVRDDVDVTVEFVE